MTWIASVGNAKSRDSIRKPTKRDFIKLSNRVSRKTRFLGFCSTQVHNIDFLSIETLIRFQNLNISHPLPSEIKRAA